MHRENVKQKTTRSFKTWNAKVIEADKKPDLTLILRKRTDKFGLPRYIHTTATISLCFYHAVVGWVIVYENRLEGYYDYYDECY